jgi:Flp pilus assembly protein TadB
MIWLHLLEVFLISMLGYFLFKNAFTISHGLLALQTQSHTIARGVLFERLLDTLLASGLGRQQSDHWWKQNWNIFRVLFVASIPLCALTGFYLILLFPWMYAIYKYYSLIRSVRLRKYQILKRIPFVLDMLILNLQSGLDFVSSLEELVGMHDAHPLHDEIRITLQSIHVGETRTQAFHNLGTRTQVVELSHLASVIRQSESMGSSLIELLKLQSHEIRHRIFKQAEAEAQKAPVKILIPMLGCIFPVVFIILFVPIGIQLFNSMK